MYSVKLRSMNPSARQLRGMLHTVKTNHPFLVRLGSRTPTTEIFSRISGVRELNSIESIENSRSKLRMRDCFEKAEVSMASGFTNVPNVALDKEVKFPILIKRDYGSKGRGMEKIDTKEDLDKWLKKNNSTGFYVEEYKDYGKEYRLHATQNEVFLSWRKVRRSDAEQKWFFNSTNCNWLNEGHENFEKPKAWDLMCQHAVKAMRATGLSIGAVDIRCKKDAKTENDFIVCEVNSAPELGEVGTVEYFKVLNKIIKENDSK
jgi:glutathione synthase/RimK-type ligase-like ATP-grasp enzyme